MLRRISTAVMAPALLLVPLAAGAQTAAPTSPAQALASLKIDIPHTKFVLRNGLTLIVHEDNKAPIVHFNIWYHVGSKNEPRGQSGFAHLFEHLMFNGSENFNDDFFKATRADRRHRPERHHQRRTAPTTSRTSRRQRSTHPVARVRPHGPPPRRASTRRGSTSSAASCRTRSGRARTSRTAIAQDLIIRATYPDEHPYGHSVIGSMDDLKPPRSTRCSDGSAPTTGRRTRSWRSPATSRRTKRAPRSSGTSATFNPGPPVAHPKAWVAKRSGRSTRGHARSRAAAASVEDLEHPEYGPPRRDAARCVRRRARRDRTLAPDKRLVYDEQIATDVDAFAGASEIAGQFTIDRRRRKPGADMARIERVVDEEMARLIADGPTAAELEKVGTQRARVLRGLERIGG